MEFDKYEFIVFGDGARLEALLTKFIHNQRIFVTSLPRTENYENDAIKNGKLLARLGIYPKGLPKNLIKHVFLSTDLNTIEDNLDKTTLESFGINHGIYVQHKNDFPYEGWMNIVEFGNFPVVNNSEIEKLITELGDFNESGQLSWDNPTPPVDLGYLTETNGLHRLLISDSGIAFSFFQNNNKLSINSKMSDINVAFTSELDEIRQRISMPFGLETYVPLLISIAASQNGVPVRFYTKFNGKTGGETYNVDIDHWIGYQLNDTYYVIETGTLRTFEVNERFMTVFHQIQLNAPSNDANEVIGILKEND
ncbi:hypothetical protein K1728_12085 (plasmid) [Weissella confusa]|uniref:hypothetical protein n=1 Tax=Weissella confusa TaxID=1583 RepID=UPI001C6FAA5B|nr:hypothetical protein [Weissella confusa]QYU59002.1 hypothetical protein K1728_12085 [Weissella confusa]